MKEMSEKDFLMAMVVNPLLFVLGVIVLPSLVEWLVDNLLN